LGILSGVVSYIFGLVLNLLDTAIDGFLGALGFDLDSFESYFPAAVDYHEVIIGFAVGLLFIMFIFQIFRNFGIVLDMEAEDPLKTLGKTALFFGMIMSSRSITNYIIQLLVDPYAIFTNAPSAPYEFKLRTIVTGMFNSAYSNPFMAVVVLIMMLILGWQFLKLCIEVVERYIVFYFVIYTAPVVFATGPFKSTSQIFKSWCRMLASQAMLLLLNVWCIKLFLSFMPVFELGGGDVGSVFFNFLIGYAFLKFAQKADTLLRILGLSTASTGDIIHSLGGTVAGIAHAISSIGGGISKGISGLSGLAGSIFGKGVGAAADATSTAANVAANAGGSAVGGMAGGIAGQVANALGGGASSGGGGSSRGGGAGRSSGSRRNAEEPEGVISSGISSAKQHYTDDVLNTARDQMGAADSAAQQGLGESIAEENGGGLPEDNIRMDSRTNSTGDPRSINDETMEGLANLAHGIPHNKYNPETNSFSGGGFREFTGRDANLIGSSQLMPADGVEQFHVDMGNGETGTVYKDSATGDAHVVQFGSVDNGVIQGSISKIDPSTGALGEKMPFQAVHESVPGASGLGDHSVPISDSQGGVYHLNTEAPTSFFAPGQSSVMQGGSAAPGSSPAPEAGSIFGGGGFSRGGGAGRSSTEGFSNRGTFGGREGGSYAGSADAGVTVPGPDNVTPGGGIGSPDAGASVPGPATEPDYSGIFGGGSSRGSGVGRSSDRGFVGDGEFGGRGGGQFGGQGDSSPDGDIPREGRRGGGGRTTESPPIDAGMQSPGNEVRRFGKDNPANLEVFKRESNVESYNKYTPDTVPLDLDD